MAKDVKWVYRNGKLDSKVTTSTDSRGNREVTRQKANYTLFGNREATRITSRTKYVK